MIRSWLFWVLVIGASALMWFLPALIAVIRGVGGLGLVVLVNALCLIIPLPGWFAAMYAAFAMPGRLARETVYPPSARTAK